MKKGLWEEVIDRDAIFIWELTNGVESYAVWRSKKPLICVVEVLDPANPRRCAGRQTVDHVKDAARLGKKAPDDALHLVAMCEAHNVWYPPSRALRQAERAYLARYRPPPPPADFGLQRFR